MAQETAGTIGIPVLKNELLPYLTDYAKRSERAELYKQKAQQRAAELAAKRAAEDAKFVPKFESSRGGLFSHVTEAKQKQRINQALDIYRDPSTPQQAKILTANEANRLNMDDADYEKQLETAIYKTAEDLQKNRLRKVGTDVVRSWASQQQDYTSPEEFAKQVRSNPDFIDFDAIGKRGKEYKQSRYSIEAPSGGTTKQVEMSPLFEYKWEKDPFTGGEVPIVTGVNGVEAQKLIDSDPDIREAYDVFVKSKGSTPEAAQQFLENAFGRYGKVKYGQSFKMPTSGEAAVKSATDNSYRVGENRVQVRTVDNAGNVVYRQGKIGSSKDRGWPLSTTNHQAGLVGVPISKLESTDEGSIFIDNKDGTITMNRSFTYDNPIRRTVYRAKQDIQMFDSNGRPKYLIKKGDILDNIDAGIVLSSPVSSRIKKQKGYEITARAKSPVGDEEKEIRIWVQDADAGSIMGNIQKSQPKVPTEKIKEIQKLIF